MPFTGRRRTARAIRDDSRVNAESRRRAPRPRNTIARAVSSPPRARAALRVVYRRREDTSINASAGRRAEEEERRPRLGFPAEGVFASIKVASRRRRFVRDRDRDRARSVNASGAGASAMHLELVDPHHVHGWTRTRGSRRRGDASGARVPRWTCARWWLASGAGAGARPCGRVGRPQEFSFLRCRTVACAPGGRLRRSARLHHPRAFAATLPRTVTSTSTCTSPRWWRRRATSCCSAC